MRILLDALPLTGLLTGISRYLRSLYEHIVTDPDVFVDYFTGFQTVAEFPKQADPKSWIRMSETVWTLPAPVVVGLRAVRWWMLEQQIRRAWKHGGYDIYHETAFCPAALKNAPQVFTLHDLSLLKYREMHPKERVWFSDLFFKRRLKHARHIITVSEFIRGEIIEDLGIAPQDVTAVPEAPAPFFFPRASKAAAETKSKYGLPDEYLLFVGTLEPRKNLKVLIEAMARTKHSLHVVLTGWKGWGEKPWEKRAQELGVAKRLHITDYVDEESLACLYSGALALVYPSVYEGFGLPVLEAMACGCPVICSNAASLPEVAGNAAVLIDPADPGNLAAELDHIAEDTEFRNNLIERSMRRAADFSWQETARATLDIFKATAEC